MFVGSIVPFGRTQIRIWVSTYELPTTHHAAIIISSDTGIVFVSRSFNYILRNIYLHFSELLEMMQCH